MNDHGRGMASPLHVPIARRGEAMPRPYPASPTVREARLAHNPEAMPRPQPCSCREQRSGWTIVGAAHARPATNGVGIIDNGRRMRRPYGPFGRVIPTALIHTTTASA